MNGDKFAVISPGLTIDNYKTIKSKIEDECQELKSRLLQPYAIAFKTDFVMFPSLKQGYSLKGLIEKFTSLSEYK